MEKKRIEEMTFEESLQELEEINDKLERNRVSLEETIQLYERGMELIDYCSKKLEEAEGEIKKIMEKNGEEILEVFE